MLAACQPTFELHAAQLCFACAQVSGHDAAALVLRAGGPPFAFPITAFYGDADRRVTEAHVRGWARFTSGAFACTRMQGHHLWPLQRGPKTAWLQAIADGLTVLAGGGRGTGYPGTGAA